MTKKVCEIKTEVCIILSLSLHPGIQMDSGEPLIRETYIVLMECTLPAPVHATENGLHVNYGSRQSLYNSIKTACSLHANLWDKGSDS